MAELAENDESLRTLEEVLKNQDPDKMPSTKEFLNLVDSSAVPEEMKENLRNMLIGNVPRVFGGYGSYLAVVFVILIFLIILFFGYKLYKSIKEKETKREEKKKLKQMKKKK